MLHQLTTEGVNPASERIDDCSAAEIVRVIHQEDMKVAEAVGAVAPQIAEGIERIAAAMRSGGRLVYIGAGTSGRLGVLDASECPPTFNTDPSLVVGLIAGGREALTRAIEGAEDDAAAGKRDLQGIGFCASDVLVGIASSGRTPYVIGALRYARELEACTIGLVCNSPSEIDGIVDVLIAPIPGPEILSGSTRMKAGTATKMVLNMLSTGAMIRLGKTYGNVMVDLQLTNAKLVERARKIVMTLGRVSYDEAARLLTECDGHVKTALVMAACNCSREIAAKRLAASHGFVRPAMEHNA